MENWIYKFPLTIKCKFIFLMLIFLRRTIVTNLRDCHDLFMNAKSDVCSSEIILFQYIIFRRNLSDQVNV